MPRITPIRLAAACALALVLSLSIAPGALAKGFSAKLRVVGAGGTILAEKNVSTATTSVKTSARATCFGEGTGGSGKAVSIKGSTGLGLLARASKTTATLRPLSISDHFDFGLALCGVGQSIAKGESSWYLKIDHKAQQVSGDAATIRRGDEVLWALAKTSAPSFTYPDELALVAPRKAKAGQGFGVRVFSYDEKGKRTPAAGVKVTGAPALTGADGGTVVTLRAPRLLRATKKGEIPAAKVAVCVGGRCPGGSRRR
jgi:hypothetical protein